MYSFNSSINAMSSSLSIGTDFKQSSATFAGTNASVASGLKDIYALDMELTDEHGEPLDCATTALLFSSKAALRASNSKSIATTMQSIERQVHQKRATNGLSSDGAAKVW
jgi:hypothetical protein